VAAGVASLGAVTEKSGAGASNHDALQPVRHGVPEHGRVPKYFAVKTEVAALLDELGEAAVLPTERELAERFGVARMTVRQAIRELRLEGRVARRGRNSVVAGPKLAQPLALVSYTEGVRRQGLRPSRRLLTRCVVAADAAMAERLGIAEGAGALHLERLLLADDECVGIESTYLPTSRFPGLAEEFDPETSLYAYLKGPLGVVFAQADERIETVLATPREAALIGTSPALPMLLLHRRSLDPSGTPIEFVRSLYRGDRFSFTAHLTADE
jgi:GntR family transcriptional regulator